MTQRMTHPQAVALARLIHTLRGDWDEPGIIAAIGAARDRAPAPDLAIAAIRAAGLASNRSPAIIRLDGPHWRPTTGARPRPIETRPEETCSVCSLHRDRCRARWSDDHDFQPKTTPVVSSPADLVAQTRATLRQRRWDRRRIDNDRDLEEGGQ